MTKVDKIIQDVRKRGILTERGYRASYSYRTMDKDDIIRSVDKVKFVISIDDVNLTVYIEKKYFDNIINYQRGYLGYYHYIWDGDLHKFYLPNDDVFDGKPFFTTDIYERRRLKLNTIIKNLKTYNYEI